MKFTFAIQFISLISFSLFTLKAITMHDKRTTMEAVTDQIRKRIAEHAWRPGERIPTKMELIDLFGASDMTVQRALTLACSQGFIVSRGCKGTFVAERPPHLHRFGLILPRGADTSLMLKTLVQAARRTHAWWLTIHEECFQWGTEPASAEMIQVEREVNESRFAGLIIAAPTFAVSRPNILTRPGLPRLFITDQCHPELGAGCHFEGARKTALCELARHGRRRVGLVGSLNMVAGGEATWLRKLHKDAKDCGLTFRDEWAQAVDKDSPGAIRQAVRLLLSLPAKSRPDGLYIMDDHLVTAACEGVVLSGVPMSQLTVVTHANFPNPQPAAVPVVDVGFDIEKLLEAALQKVSQGVSEKRELGPDDWITARAEVRERSPHLR
jgi:DNA-binding transcriptional regulator YhcF (GntR family)